MKIYSCENGSQPQQLKKYTMFGSILNATVLHQKIHQDCESGNDTTSIPIHRRNRNQLHRCTYGNAIFNDTKSENVYNTIL